jgi:hypothetical protein
MIRVYPEPEEMGTGELCESASGESDGVGSPRDGEWGAMPTERLHGILRGMSDEEWAALKQLLIERLNLAMREKGLDVLERLFRKGENIGGQSGGTVFQVIHAITADTVVMERVKEAHESMRMRVRFVLKEMSNEAWNLFVPLLERHLGVRDEGRSENIGVLELVFRIGESVSNVEVAASAMADKLSGRKLIHPEVARKNAMITVFKPGTTRLDPEVAYRAAERAINEAKEIARRGENTLAYRYVEPTAAFKHARNTVFKIVDFILENQELRLEIARIGVELAAIKPVSREQMRWALHRMPLEDQMKVIKLIPLNIILMFQDGEDAAKGQDLEFKAIRDRRLAYDLFVEGQSESELMAKFGFSLNALKNAAGVILQTLSGRPMARKIVNAYLERVERIESMSVHEVRRRMKQLTPAQRAAVLSKIPNCAWKVRDVIHVHKHLFLDYVSGEWVLGALVEYYNLEKSKRLTGTFKCEGTMTVRGAHSAIAGILSKIAQEPELRAQLRDMSITPSQTAQPAIVNTEIIPEKELSVEDLMPVHVPRVAFSNSISM